jgi:hypothetical protein
VTNDLCRDTMTTSNKDKSPSKLRGNPPSYSQSSSLASSPVSPLGFHSQLRKASVFTANMKIPWSIGHRQGQTLEMSMVQVYLDGGLPYDAS